MGGSRLVRARTAVDLPVPLRPQMRTPPIDGLMALRMRASRIFCCPTIALNGNVAMFLLSLLVPPCAGSGTRRYISLPLSETWTFVDKPHWYRFGCSFTQGSFTFCFQKARAALSRAVKSRVTRGTHQFKVG